MRPAALLLLLTAACSQSSTTTGHDDMGGLPSVSEVCLMAAGARQTARLGCSGIQQSFALNVYDADDCARRERSAAAGQLTLDRAQLGKCLAAIQAASCDTLALGQWLGKQPAECTAMYVAHSAIGGSCFDAFDCQSGSTCHNSQCPGTCDKLAAAGDPCDVGCTTPLSCGTNNTCQPPATQGQSCQNFECADGLYCDFSGAPPLCQPYKPAGASCQMNAGGCQPPLDCFGGVCGPVPKLGESCTPGGYWPCQYGLACDAATMKCVLWRGENEACYREFECAPDFICTTPGGGNGTCVRWLEAGASCDPNTYRCRPPTVCSDGTCKITSDCS